MAIPKAIKFEPLPDGYSGPPPELFAVVGEAPGGGGETGPRGPEGPQGPAGADGADGADGFGTESQYNDIISRLEALENGED